jgi:hypothetical protein
VTETLYVQEIDVRTRRGIWLRPLLPAQ